MQNSDSALDLGNRDYALGLFLDLNACSISPRDIEGAADRMSRCSNESTLSRSIVLIP